MSFNISNMLDYLNVAMNTTAVDIAAMCNQELQLMLESAGLSDDKCVPVISIVTEYYPNGTTWHAKISLRFISVSPVGWLSNTMYIILINLHTCKIKDNRVCYPLILSDIRDAGKELQCLSKAELAQAIWSKPYLLRD